MFRKYLASVVHRDTNSVYKWKIVIDITMLKAWDTKLDLMNTLLQIRIIQRNGKNWLFEAKLMIIICMRYEMKRDLNIYTKNSLNK